MFNGGKSFAERPKWRPEIAARVACDLSVQHAVEEKDIQPEDIYNIDETGFAMGLFKADGSYASRTRLSVV